MAKRKAKKRATKKKTRSKRASSASVRPRAAVKSRQGIETPDELKVQIWLMREEGGSRGSLRSIAKSLGVATSTVQLVLASDRARLMRIYLFEKDEHRVHWRGMGTSSIRLLDTLLHETEDILIDKKTGRRRKRIRSALDQVFIDDVKRLAGPLRMAADSASKRTDALAPTAGDLDAIDPLSSLIDDDDALVEAARQEGLLDRLPAFLRERAGLVPKP